MLVRSQHTFPVSQHIIDGQAIAKTHWSPRQRARRAAEWKLDLIQVRPTTKLSAEVFSVSVPLVVDAIKDLESTVTIGELAHRWFDGIWAGMSDDERNRFVRGRLVELWDRIDRLTR
jgi:hypothetical protein